MAQQARPKVAGQIEDRRAQFTVQFTMLSSLVSRTPRSTSAASSAVTPGTAKTSVLIPRPLQAAKKPGFAQAAQKGPDARSARRDATPILRMGARRATAPEADRWVFFSSLLGCEARPAAAAPLGVGVLQREAGPCERVHVVDLGPAEVEEGLRVHDDFDPILLEDLIPGLRGIEGLGATH